MQRYDNPPQLKYASALYKSIEKILYHPDATTVLTVFEDKNEKLPVFSLDLSNLPKDDVALLEKIEGDLKSVQRAPGYVLVFKAKRGKINYRNFDVVHVSDLGEYFQLQEVNNYGPGNKLDKDRSNLRRSYGRECGINFEDDSPLGDDIDGANLEDYGYGPGNILRLKD